MSKKLYILAHTFDEGFDGPDFLYYAHSRLEVAEKIVSDVQSQTEVGEKLRRIFSSMSVADRAFGYDVELSDEQNTSKRALFSTTRSPQELLDLIDASIVDGDSFARVTLFEYNLSNVIDLTSGADNSQVEVDKKMKGETTNIGEKGEIEIVDSTYSIIEVINCAFRDYEVSHLVWEEKSWYSHNLPGWREERWVPSGQVGEHDPDHPCYGYWGHVFDAKAEDKDGDPDEEVPLPYKPLQVEKIDDVKHIFVSTRVKRSPTFDLQRKICLLRTWHIVNDSGLNDDHRGSNHLGIDIDHLFDGSVDIDPGVYTFAELANLIWRVKANKFDNQYEMVFPLEREGIRFDGHDWHVGLTVDHGS